MTFMTCSIYFRQIQRIWKKSGKKEWNNRETSITSLDFVKKSFKTWKTGWPVGAVLKEKLSSCTRNQGSKGQNNKWYNYRNKKPKFGYRYWPHDLEKSHRIGQSRLPREKPRPITVKFVQYKDRNKIPRNKKSL